MRFHTALCLVLLGFVQSIPATEPAGGLEAGFQSPPRSARPLTWWHWLNGNITTEGLKADLEGIAAAGLGGVQIFDLNVKTPKGPIRYGSDAWHRHMQFAIATAGRLGLSVDLMNCPGWSTSGGSWITVDQSMKDLVWSETETSGPAQRTIKLAMPRSEKGFYREVAVLAVPADPRDEPPLAIRTETRPDVLSFLTDDNLKTAIALTSASSPCYVELHYAQPVERRHLELIFGQTDRAGRISGEIQATQEDGAIKTVGKFDLNAGYKGDRYVISTPFAATRARVFRVVFAPEMLSNPNVAPLAEISLTNALRAENYEGKTIRSIVEISRERGFGSESQPGAIQPAQILNLTDKLQADGTLQWTAPAGRWTILRFGYTTTGAMIHPVAPDLDGLEVDKMDPAAVQNHFDHAVGRILREAGPLAGKTLTGILSDSWECGPQTWTARFPEGFANFRGYELVPWLPALTGRVIESSRATDAFLADYRRTLSDLIGQNYYGTLRDAAHRNGVQLYAETYGNNSPLNFFLAGPYADINMSEFWTLATGNGGMADMKERASLVHTLGRTLLASEAFTASYQSKYITSPRSLKLVGDLAFLNGVNRLVLHSTVHQPRLDVWPGLTLGRYGTHFGRLNTWWPQARAWVDYLSRCQFLLQQGRYNADLLILCHEEIDRYVKEQTRHPAIPYGYDFDFIAPAQLLTSHPAGQRIQLESGSIYRALLLPDAWSADLALLQVIKKFKAAGVPVYGPPPTAARGLTALRKATQIEELVNTLWPKGATEETITNPTALDEFLSNQKLAPDFRVADASQQQFIQALHRSTAQADLYFVVNKAETAQTFDAAFRINDKRPELWDPLTGKCQPAQAYTVSGEHTSLTLSLAPYQSMFVVFRQPAPQVHAVAYLTTDSKRLQPESGAVTEPVSVTQPGSYQQLNNDGSAKKIVIASVPTPQVLPGPWHLNFKQPGVAPFERTLSQLGHWNESSDDAVRYFSGTATYQTSFTLPNSGLQPGQRVRLDLGVVNELAEVRVNGTSAAILWTPPFGVDVTRLLRPGVNHLEIAVTNTWTNRLIGDEHLPAEAEYNTTGSANTINGVKAFPAWYTDPTRMAEHRRSTFSMWHHYEKDSPLQPSGLVGPVTLRYAATLEP